MDIKMVSSQEEGLDLAKNLLYEKVDRKTVLFLSGGKTPKDLYISLVKEQKIKPGKVAVVDERYGKRMHIDSNEKMLQDTGFLNYLKKENIPFCGILKKNWDLKDTVLRYDQNLRMLFSNFPKSVGILGVGLDGHTASLAAGAQSSHLVTKQANRKTQNYVTKVTDFPTKPRERITMTFLGLSMLDSLIVLVFGSAKQNALRKMFEQGPLEEIPARFFLRPDIARKTILITDQKI